VGSIVWIATFAHLSLEGLEELVGNMGTQLDIEIGLSCVIPAGVGQTNAHQQYQQQFENTEAFATPVTIGNRESLMDAMWEARGSAFRVIEERWKTFEKDGKTVSESGQRRIRDREIATLRKLYELARFIATHTFGTDIDPVLDSTSVITEIVSSISTLTKKRRHGPYEQLQIRFR
jgi:hypothetical protein